MSKKQEKLAKDTKGETLPFYQTRKCDPVNQASLDKSIPVRSHSDMRNRLQVGDGDITSMEEDGRFLYVTAGEATFRVPLSNVLRLD